MTRTCYRWASLAVLALLLAALLTLPARTTPARASQYQMVLRQLTPQVRALMLRQEPLATAADRLQSALSRDTAGFAGIQLAVPARHVVLSWHGSVPAAVRALVGRVNRSLGKNGHVIIKPAAYAWATLYAQAYRLIGTTAHRWKVVSAEIIPGGSGLHLTLAAPTSAHYPRTAIPQVRSTVHVTVSAGTAPAAAFGRWGDTAPYNGGAAIANITAGVECSSGFTMHNSAGQTFLLTAGHCGATGNQWITPNQGLFIGTTTEVSTPQHLDAEIIAAPAEPFMYNGGPDPSGQGIGESLAGISSVSFAAIGELVCQLGAFSGPRCNIKTTAEGFIYLNGSPVLTIQAQTTDGSEAIGNGDSGGPVITLGPPGFFVAVGTNSAQDLNSLTSCVGVQVPGRECSSRMWFTEVVSAQSTTGTSVSIAPGG